MGTFEKLGLRVLSAVIGIAAILAILVYSGPPGVKLLTAFIGLLAFVEFFGLVFPEPKMRIDRFVCLGLGLLVLVDRIYGPLSLSFLMISIIALFSYFLFRARGYQGNLQHCLFSLSLSLLGIIYIAFLLSYFPRLYVQNDGLHWTLTALLIPWAYDTGAYFSGKKMGRHKLYLIISPGKTWEGVMGGVILTLLSLILFSLFSTVQFTLTDLLILSVGGAFFAQVGDLFESLLKRGLGVKDSGRLIPGHGGILDRLDALLFVFPFVFAYVLMRG